MDEAEFAARARLLLVDDLEDNLVLLERILARAGYRALTRTTDPTQVVDMVRAGEPDIILLDLHMPAMNGFEVMDALGAVIPADGFVPILVLTADISSEAKQQALACGAKDFLHKPFDPVEVVLRVRNLLQTRRLYLELKAQNAVLEERVRERTRELEAAKAEILRLVTRW